MDPETTSGGSEPKVLAGERKMALLLRAMDLPRVHRDILRALYPAGEAYRKICPNGQRRNINPQSNRFAAALGNLKRRGFITKTASQVEVIDYHGLASHALDSATGLDELRLAECRSVAEADPADGDLELRQLEVAALKRVSAMASVIEIDRTPKAGRFFLHAHAITEDGQVERCNIIRVGPNFVHYKSGVDTSGNGGNKWQYERANFNDIVREWLS
ncbi:hypothetical protein ACIQC7_34575 [Kitasatospora sp. NPDC088556]|uniref:hypothetical protein n=1 Tax=Kitasatospora sp. NPDC088556 TaxID=3364076 RepID=UPI0037F17BAF